MEKIRSKIAHYSEWIREHWKYTLLFISVTALSLIGFVASLYGYYEVYMWVRTIIYIGSLGYFLYYYVIKKIVSYLKERKGE